MDSFFEEIIPPTAVAQMNQLGQSIDIFQTSMKQILSFQNMLYQGLKTLTGKYSSLKNEVNFLNNQLLNVDDAVQNYLARNPIQVYTRDGQTLDDAIDDISNRLQSVFARLSKGETKSEKFENFMETCVSSSDVAELREKISQNNTLINTQNNAIETLQNAINKSEEKVEGLGGNTQKTNFFFISFHKYSSFSPLS